MSRSEGEQEIMSKLNISKDMHEVFAKLNNFLDKASLISFSFLVAMFFS